MQKFVGDGVGTIVRAELRRQYMLMAYGFRMLKFRIVEVFSPQPVPQAFALHAAPGLAKLLRRERQQFCHGVDAMRSEAPLHTAADADQITQG